MKLRFAGLLEPAQRVEVLTRMRASHDERVAQLEARLQAGHFDDPFHKLTIEYGLGWNRWARDWCEGVLESLGEPHRPTAEGAPESAGPQDELAYAAGRDSARRGTTPPA